MNKFLAFQTENKKEEIKMQFERKSLQNIFEENSS